MRQNESGGQGEGRNSPGKQKMLRGCLYYSLKNETKHLKNVFENLADR